MLHLCVKATYPYYHFTGYSVGLYSRNHSSYDEFQTSTFMMKQVLILVKPSKFGNFCLQLSFLIRLWALISRICFLYFLPHTGVSRFCIMLLALLFVFHKAYIMRCWIVSSQWKLNPNILVQLLLLSVQVCVVMTVFCLWEFSIWI